MCTYGIFSREITTPHIRSYTMYRYGFGQTCLHSIQPAIEIAHMFFAIFHATLTSFK